jgi:hypothetical protein
LISKITTPLLLPLLPLLLKKSYKAFFNLYKTTPLTTFV